MGAITWKDRVKQAVSSGGTGALTLGAAASGFQAFAAGDDGKKFMYVIEDGTAWETGLGTYTHSGTSFARTARFASSTGSALDVTTAAHVFVDWNAGMAGYADLGCQAIIPGGRLTLSSGVPVTTSDVTGATNVYYTPYLHNVIVLWDGNRWVPVEFSEVTQALGTVNSGRPYDVFAYLSAGALATEILTWTNDTTRGTGISLQDGRYCKTGDKTRLYLGTFRTTSTTTTEDSAGGAHQAGGKRFLWNMYNRVERMLSVIDTTDTWTYKTATTRQAQAAAGNKVECVLGLAGQALHAMVSAHIFNQTGTSTGRVGVGLDTTSAFSGYPSESGNAIGTAAIWQQIIGRYDGYPAEGYHYLSWNENGGGTSGTQLWLGDDSGSMQSNLTARVWS